MYFLENILLFYGLWFRQTQCVVMITKEGSTEVVNFMTPGAGFFARGWSYQSYYFFKILGIDQTEESTKIVNFMTPRGRGSCARVWPYKSYSENAIFLLKI